MTKKIIIGIIGFTAGISIGFYFESFFRGTIQDIFRFTTSEKIQFIGKNISIFQNRTYEYALGFALTILLIANVGFKTNRILKNIILCLLIFGISIFIISAINANLKVIQCTACDNGIVKIHWNDIDFGLTIGLSAIISIIPSITTLRDKLKSSITQS